MIDDVGLVNMNGRIYDPEIGRFMSADPIVQDPTDTQSLNRYTYVGNNPLSYTDPTGYFSLGKLLRTIIAIVIVVVAAIYGQYWVAGAGLAAEGSTAAYAIAGAIGGAIAGGITGGDLRSVLVGAVSGAAFSGLGAAAKAGQISATQHVVAAGMTGGVTSVAQGGNFQSGFLAAGFSAIASPYIDSVANDNIIVGATASAAIGGTASVLGGGKFANGAVTGAFSYAVGRAMQSAAAYDASPEVEEESLGEYLAKSWEDGKYDIAGRSIGRYAEPCLVAAVGPTPCAGLGGGGGGAKPLLGQNPSYTKNRTNTDLTGDRSTAKSISRNQTRGHKIEQIEMPNGGTRRTAPDGSQIRINPDGTNRLDLPGRGPRPNGETIHIPPRR